MQFENSQAINEYVRDLGGGDVILSFSLRKDSVAAWIEMKKYYKKIVPYYLYMVPDLEFVQRSIDYYQEFFQTHIYCLPHPSVHRMLKSLIFQAPQNCAIVEAANLVDFDYQDINDLIRLDQGFSENVYTASGVRARDSLNRWASIKKYGALNENKKTFFPIFDFDKKMMVDTLKASGVKLAADYRLFGRSFDGIDYRFIGPIKEHYPRDYAKIMEFFPLVELELKRIEYREKYLKKEKSNNG